MDELKRRLLNFYKELYRKNPNKYKGACKASRKLKLSKKEYGYNYWKTHNLLQELEREGYLEQKAGYGFRKKYCSNNQNTKQEQSESTTIKTEAEEAHKKLFLIMEKAEEIKDEVLFLSEDITELYVDILENLNRTKE